MDSKQYINKVINLQNQLKLEMSHDKRTQINKQIQEIYIKNPEIQNGNRQNAKLQNINNIFTKYFPELQNKYVHYYDIQAYKILNIKLDKIIELNKIKAIYKSNDIVKQILLELYDKRFTILEKV